MAKKELRFKHVRFVALNFEVIEDPENQETYLEIKIPEEEIPGMLIAGLEDMHLTTSQIHEVVEHAKKLAVLNYLRESIVQI